MRKIAQGNKESAKHIADEIRALSANPRPQNAERLIDQLFRIRVGEYRIIYAIFDEEESMVIGKIARRSEGTYKNLDEILKKAKRVISNKNP